MAPHEQQKASEKAMTVSLAYSDYAQDAESDLGSSITLWYHSRRIDSTQSSLRGHC